MDGVMGMQMAQFQTNYTYAMMKMSMQDQASEAQAMIDMMSEVPVAQAAPAQYSFDVWA